MMPQLVHKLLGCVEHETRGSEGVEGRAELWPVQTQKGELSDGRGDVGLDGGLKLGVEGAVQREGQPCY